MAQYPKYEISAQRLTGIADQARRLGKVSGKLTPGQIQETLTGVGSLSNAEETTFGYVKKTETVTEQAPEGKCWYNGVLLPEIPTDVLASFPYCWIRHKVQEDSFQLYLAELPWFYNTSYDALDVAIGYYREYYVISGGSWVKDSTIGTVVSLDSDNVCLWSNHNIPYGSATATEIYFEGSEPLTELTETITKHVPVERESNYSITSESLNNIAKRTQEMAGTSKLLTPDDIIYWLGRVMFVPQGFAESILTLTELEANGNSSGIIPTVHRGAVSGELIVPEMICNGSASGIFEV